MAKKKYAAQSRHRARELAVQLLYSLELRPGLDMDECAEAFTKWGAASGPDVTGEMKDYMYFLVSRVWRARFDIDGIMRRIVTGWRLERMVAADRAVLRVAIFEGFLEKEVPVAVAISEAVGLAGAFGTEDSARFVNGVLSKVLRYMEGDGEGETETGGEADGKPGAASAP